LFFRSVNNAKQPNFYATVNPEYSSIAYEQDEYEVPPDSIELLGEIGHGHFGKVCWLVSSYGARAACMPDSYFFPDGAVKILHRLFYTFYTV